MIENTDVLPKGPALGDSGGAAVIVAAFIQSKHGAVNIEDMGTVIGTIYSAVRAVSGAPLFLNAEQPQEPAPELTPAVPIEKSITPDYLISLETGEKFKSLKRHLFTKYGMSPADYREKWSLPPDYPMVAPAYSARRKDLAIGQGLGKPKPPVKAARRKAARR